MFYYFSFVSASAHVKKTCFTYCVGWGIVSRDSIVDSDFLRASNNRRSVQRSQILLLSTATRCFSGPTRVLDANGISIASAVYAGLTRWQTDWQTDRPRYLVGNRRSVQWRSQVLLLSTATTSIFWSSRLNRSDQLQQSAAVYSVVRLDGLQCMWRHYNIASKRAFTTGVPDRWQNCLLIYWRTSCLVPAFDDT